MNNLDSLLAAFVLSLAYILGKKVDAVHVAHRRRWISIAAGVSVAYVFVHVLPELSETQAMLLEAVQEQRLLFTEVQVYLAVLIGFILFYGIDSVVVFTRTPEHLVEQTHRREDTVYWVHLAGFAVYSAMVSYLIVDWTRGFMSLILYTAALALHLLVVDHSLRTEYGARYNVQGRWLLAGSLLTGWLIGVFAPLQPAPLAAFVGFISGGVVINSLKDELPQSGVGRFIPFAFGALTYSLLLLV